MMRYFTFSCFVLLNLSIQAKEWNSLRIFQKETHQEDLALTDWLASDRRHNTKVWQQANIYNLEHGLFEEYKTIKERKDFYAWIFAELKRKGNEIVWVHMAHFVSKKLHLLEVFPFTLFSNKKIIKYADEGSAAVFKQAFIQLQEVYNSHDILKGDEARRWDEKMAYNEQYVWLTGVYKTIDERSLKTIERMAKGKGIYGLFVRKIIRFKGDISKPEVRYSYAVNTLRNYCINSYK